MSITLQVRGEEEVLEALDLDVEGQLGTVLDRILTLGADHARGTTPVDTGAMARAWMWARGGLEGGIMIDPSATNPVSGARVSDYAPAVDDRLGILQGAYDRLLTVEITEVGFDG